MLTDIERYARNTQMADIQPFIIDIPATDITELQNRLNATRWPDPETPDDWSQGVPLQYAQEFCRYWGEEYDWSARQEQLNRFDHFTHWQYLFHPP